MFRSAITILIVAAAATPAQKAPDADEKEFTIRSEVRLVLLDVSVRDAAGGFVSGLTKDNFRVYEDGKPKEITEFANQDIPVTVGIVVDESGSMRPKRRETITAALTFIESSNPQDEVFVVNFNEKVYHGLPAAVLFTDNIAMLRNALWATPAEGRTALYDATFASLQQLDMGRRDKKTLVVISDGGDNVSTHTRKDVERKMNESPATVYTIGIFDADDPDRNPDVLKRLASVSGGVAYFPQDLEGIVPVCRQIAKDIRTRYTIGYIAGDNKPGQLRHIKVTVAAPDRGKLTARTRTQYMYNADDSADRQTGREIHAQAKE
jgi:Ca-activated chloride channel homolog